MISTIVTIIIVSICGVSQTHNVTINNSSSQIGQHNSNHTITHIKVK